MSDLFDANNDFAVSGTDAGDILFYDVSAGRLGINETSPDAALHVVTDCALDGLKIENQSNCATGVRVLLLHNSQTPPETGSLPVTIDLAGRDSNYTTINYAQIKSKILDPATSQTSGELLFTVDHTGVNREIFRSSLVNTVLGGLNNVSGHFYNVLGYANTTSGLSYIVVGNNNDFTSNTGIMVGNNIQAEGDKLLVFANASSVSGNSNIVVGVDSTVSGLSNVALGTQVRTTGDNGIIIGNNSVVNGDNFVGLVSSANVSGQSGIGFGIDATAIGDGHVFLGSNLSVSGTENIAIGSNLNLSGSKNIVYGNLSDVSGNSIISIGRDNNPQSINSGVYVGNEISLTGSTKSMIIGLGVSTTSGLNDSVLIGINNDTSAGSPDSLVLVGQNNTVSNITESLVIGNDNNLTGNLSNNIVVGPRNNVPISSKNNLVVGILNNTSGIAISTDGSIVGTDTKTVGDNMANTTVFGINNWVSEASGSLVYGNKTRMSGLNINSVGSYTNLNGENIQNLGNSNFVLGTNNSVLGAYNDIVGHDSISFNTSADRNLILGSGNVVIGHNEVIVSGLSIGFDNEIYGPYNVIYGKNNTVGYARYPCRVSGTDVVVVGDITAFNGGDRVIVGIYSPVSQDESVFVGTILDGADAITNEPLGIIKENIGSNYTTTLKLSSTIESTNTIEYYVKSTFDDIVHGLDPCDECFADRFAGYSSGYVIAYQDGNDEADLIANPIYGNSNIVLGDNNVHTHGSGISIGHNNTASGVNHIMIGHGLSGNFHNTLQLGTNNTNKLIIDNTKIIFNTGQFQSSAIFSSSNPGGSNDPSALKVDMSINRVGVNIVEPRSTLDVSGTLTTEGLRVGLSTIPGYSLHADANGVATWQLPVNISGQNSGLMFRVNDKVGSGVNELIFNTGTRELTYLRADKDIEPDGEFLLGPTSVEERPLIISRSGLFLNNIGSDHGYDFIIKGSGTQDPVNGDNSVYLIKTLVDDNSIRVHNITGVSGIFNEMTVEGGMKVPVSLTGTVFKVGNNGDLVSQTFNKHSLLFTDQNFVASGNNTLRYYADSQAITIGTTGQPPITANVSLVQGASNVFNNIILGSHNGVSTVFNNAGDGGNRFIIVGSGNAGSKKGFQYDVNTGSLGVNVDTVDNNWKISSSADTNYWYEAGKLVVDGKLRVGSIQLTANGKDLPGSNSVNKYLKITDTAGNIGLDTLDLQYQFSGIHPLDVTTDTQNEIVSIRLATTNVNDVSLGAADNGLGLAWDGSKWVHNRGFKNIQPADGGSTDNTAGIELGNAISLNSCRNNHTFAAGSFASPGNANFNRMRGSSQLSNFYLRGRTLADVTSELTADWHKDANTTANLNNTISLQYTSEDDSQSADDHDRSFVWNYTINYSALFNDGTANGFGSVAGEVKGAILSYRNSDGSRTTTKMGSESNPEKRYTGVDYSSTDPITVTIENAGSDANVQRLAIKANGRPSYNGMWSVVVDVNQVHMPSGINFANSDT
mgnify:CR=1 FL=1|tara:strand:+ start:40770 stop:45248 length:4479 start_codon:yes stop_codon:yes gene_type:complete